MEVSCVMKAPSRNLFRVAGLGGLIAASIVVGSTSNDERDVTPPVDPRADSTLARPEGTGPLYREIPRSAGRSTIGTPYATSPTNYSRTSSGGSARDSTRGRSSVGTYGYEGGNSNDGVGFIAVGSPPGTGGGSSAATPNQDVYVLSGLAVVEERNRDLESDGSMIDLLLLYVGPDGAIELAPVTTGWELGEIQIPAAQVQALTSNDARLLLFDKDEKGKAPVYDFEGYDRIYGYHIATCYVGEAGDDNVYPLECDSSDVAPASQLKPID
jgi:hypothetical protein